MTHGDGVSGPLLSFWESVKPLVSGLEAKYTDFCEEYIKRWKHKPPLKSVYILVKSDEYFDKLKNDEKVIQYCNGEIVKIHLIQGIDNE